MQIKLSHPVVSDGTELRVLNLRRPKVRDVLLAAKIGGTDEEKEIRVLANLCEVAPDVVEELDIAVFSRRMAGPSGTAQGMRSNRPRPAFLVV